MLLYVCLNLLAEIIKDTNPETYVEYKNSRKLELAGSRTLALKIKVYVAGSTQFIPGVIISITVAENAGLKKKAGGSELVKNVKRTSAL